MAKQVYATVTLANGTKRRLGATLAEDGSQVLVYPAGENTSFGWYNIGRFRDGKLTSVTLRELFEVKS